MVSTSTPEDETRWPGRRRQIERCTSTSPAGSTRVPTVTPRPEARRQRGTSIGTVDPGNRQCPIREFLRDGEKKAGSKVIHTISYMPTVNREQGNLVCIASCC
jgi:hypothetical protein